MTARTLLVALALGAGTLTACGDDAAIDRSGEQLAGIEVVVGSKEFAEQELLASMFVQAFRAQGAEVTAAAASGGTAATRAALLDREIDAYVEYGTTAWFEPLGQTAEPPDDPEDLTAAVSELDETNGVVWMGRSSFDNTYGFALGPELADDERTDRYRVDGFDLDDLADLLADERDVLVCVAPEFRDRPDGLTRFEAATGFDVPADRLVTVADTVDVVDGLLTGRCDVGEVFTTSGLIARHDLALVDDDGVFAAYHASLTMRADVHDEAPETFREIAEDVLTPLTQRRMIELNRRVAAGEPIDEVARDHLLRFGVVG